VGEDLRKEQLVERDPEIAALDRALDGLTDDEGAAYAVAGPAGIGKTSVLAAAAGAARARGLTVLTARGIPLEQQFTFGFLRQLLEPPLRALDDDRRAAILADAAAPAAVALGLEPDPHATAEASPALLHALLWTIADLADDGPIVLLSDDVQWADGPSLRALAFLAHRIASVPVLLLTGVRDGEPSVDDDALAALRQAATTLALAPLSDAGIARIARASSAREFADDELEALCQATAGNPFWAVQAAGGGAYATDGLAAVVHGRLDGLGDDVRRVAHALAVLGDDTPPRVVAALAEVDDATAYSAADALHAAGVLDAPPAFSFAHPLLRAAVADDQSEYLRTHAHQRAAQLLAAAGAPAERIAAHLVHAPPNADVENVTQLVAAALDATRRGAPEAAMAFLDRAAAEPPPAELISAVTIQRGLTELRVGRFAAAASTLAPAAEAPDADPGVALVQVVAKVYAGAGDDAFVEELLAAADRQTTTAGKRPLLALAAMANWVAIPARSRIDVPAAPTDAPLDLGGHLELAARCLNASDAGPLDHASELALRALDGGRWVREYPDTTVNTAIPLWVLVQSGRVEDFDREAEEVAAIGRAHGTTEPLHLVSALRVHRDVLSGDLVRAMATVEAMHRYLADESGGGSPVLRMCMAGGAMEAALAHGGPAAAAPFLAELAAPEASGFYSTIYRSVSAAVHLAAGRVDEALAVAEAFEALRLQHNGLAGMPVWHSALPFARAAAGDHAGALDAAERFLERELVHGVDGRIASAQRVLAEIDPSRAIELLTEALERHESGPFRLEQARTHIALGRALRRVHRRAEAQSQLERGADEARRMSAGALAEVAFEELRVLGAKPRRLAFSGVDALTASERRIADLAVAGLSNRAIAQELFVAPKTVETHLRNAFRKLDVTAREQLGDVLAAAA